MKTLSTKELKNLLQREGDNFHPINVLDSDHYREKHIPGSVNIPGQETDFPEKVERFAGSKKARVVVYCASEECDASKKAAEKLEAEGFQNVSAYEPGMKGWEEAGLPVSTGSEL
jgi:rhodanese-related sulfurtransferase